MYFLLSLINFSIIVIDEWGKTGSV